MNTAEVREKAARRKCPECRGKGGFGAPGWEDDPDEYYGDCRDCDGAGLWLPMLSKACDCLTTAAGGYWPDHPYHVLGCAAPQDRRVGTDRALNIDDPEALDAAAEKLGYSGYSRHRTPRGQIRWTYFPDDGFALKVGISMTTQLARQAAFVAVVKMVCPEVEDAVNT